MNLSLGYFQLKLEKATHSFWRKSAYILLNEMLFIVRKYETDTHQCDENVLADDSWYWPVLKVCLRPHLAYDIIDYVRHPSSPVMKMRNLTYLIFV